MEERWPFGALSWSLQQLGPPLQRRAGQKYSRMFLWWNMLAEVLDWENCSVDGYPKTGGAGLVANGPRKTNVSKFFELNII